MMHWGQSTLLIDCKMKKEEEKQKKSQTANCFNRLKQANELMEE